MKLPTTLHRITFMSLSPSKPGRIGDREPIQVSTHVWAENVKEAIEIFEASPGANDPSLPMEGVIACESIGLRSLNIINPERCVQEREEFNRPQLVQ